MALFELAIYKVLEHEGGYVNDPDDPGGATKYGVSLRFLKNKGYIPEFDIDDDGQIDEDDIRKLSKEAAIQIYRQYWWERFRYDRIDSQVIANKIFDLAVNMGAKSAHRLLQHALNLLFDFDLKIDGILGPKTLQAVNYVESRGKSPVLYRAICHYAAKYYEELSDRKIQLKKFLKGWLRRAFD